MKSPEKYMRENTEKLDLTSTSVSIEKDQKKFVEDNNLNLSKMTRDMIKDFMNEAKKKNKTAS